MEAGTLLRDPCHVHCDPENPDERLEFWPSSEVTTFAYVMGCIKKHYEKRPQDWETAIQ